MHDAELVRRAQAIATDAHAGQVDKAGKPYIGHPERVAGRVDDPAGKAVAWLHDVLEDTPRTTADLLAAGLPTEVVDAVDALTRRGGEAPDSYYARVRANPLALRVKAADLDDNSDEVRLALLDEVTRARLGRKYRHAREVLGLVR